jgi:stage II sporulation protein D
MRRVATILGALIVAACASSFLPASSNDEAPPTNNDRIVRIAVGVGITSARIGATGLWTAYGAGGPEISSQRTPGESWTVERTSNGVRLVRGDVRGVGRSAEDRGPIVIKPRDKNAFVLFNDKRYRGDLIISATDSGLLVVNRLPLESYLRGVVPLEIGNRKPEEHAAVEAQAVAARSYSYLHFIPLRAYDMMSTVQDQVYGGVDAEKPVSDSAVAATAGVVVMYAGKVINTPYYSTCGGTTAAVHEVWYKEPDQPYLTQVSDRIPGTDRFYCDSSPRFRWTSSFTSQSLRTVLEKYLSAYTTAPRGPVGRVTGVYEEGRTESDRVAALRIQTDGGTYILKGNDIRFVLRSPDGAILNSTYFRTEATITSGEVSGLTLRGGGYGHGIGMCQWGAIGRARAGQDYRTILSTYYPGTTIGRMR